VPSARLRRWSHPAWLCAFLLCGGEAFASEPSRAARQGHVTGAEGVRLFYRQAGSGRRGVVFLHGGPGSNFRGQGDVMERLATHGRTVVMYDQRGSGFSDLVSDPKLLTTEHHVRDLEALRSQLGFDRVSLIGMSWGCGLAALYAAAHPDRVERLLLVGPMPPTIGRFRERVATLGRLQPSASLGERQAMVARIRQADDAETVSLCRQLSDISFRLYVVDPTPAKLAHAALRCDIPAAAIRNRYVVETATLGSLGEWDLRKLLAGIRVPSLVVEGAQTNVPLEATREWVAALPNARIVLIPDAGHESFLDQPDAFMKVGDDFLRGRWPKTSTRAVAKDD
jgi:proline iminopeptidase